ncbi:MAG: PSD1 and planctomycete cytochrome C domain-containing protein [Verrucomicrobiota bacterium]
MKRSLLLFLTLPVLTGVSRAADIPADQLQFFENRIRPALVENCYRCHSEAEGKSKGGLTLDTRAGWEKGGENGPAIVPGKPDESRLIKAVRHTDPDLAMPPKDGKLPPALIADLEKWVSMGAPDPRIQPVTTVKTGGPMTETMKAQAAKHWAFQPLRKPAVPAVTDTAWPANDLDRFVLARLEEKKLAPSPAADKRTLIRRAALDLTGLPPSPEEVLAFVGDESPQAFEKVVDRLLASPEYGERWGRHWLDVARYADTKGRTRQRETSLNPNAWTYRDYVISAFNQDKPFDQFIREQIAADLLPEASKDPASLAALGFITQGEQFAGSRPDIINDQIDVVTKGFLGLTVSCARCHDHKFDPVPQADYYSLYGVFNSCHEPDEKPVAVAAKGGSGTEAYETQRAKITGEGRQAIIAELNRQAANFNLNAGTFLKIAQAGNKTPEYYALARDIKIEGRVLQDLLQTFNRSLIIRRGEPPSPVMGPLKRLLALTPETFDARFPEWLAFVQRGDRKNRVNAAVSAAFTGVQPTTKAGALDIYASVFVKAEQQWQAESDAWSQAGGKGIFPGLKDKALREARNAVVNPDEFLTGPVGEGGLRGLARNVGSRVASELARLDVSHAGAPGLANVIYDNGRPKDSPIFLRGQIQSPGPVVPRQYLEFLSGPDRKPFTQGSGRLELAREIASPANPLTPRVLVNRVWLHHFGEGFVPTPDDLGVMSPAPENAALLDWLASKFVRDGWSLKKLHRTILLSKTWQQSSEPDAARARIDPFNHLVWRQNVRRLDFESLRDSILFMGGKLDQSMGGHPVNIESEPYSPRRSVYGFIDRIEMAEFMRSFDVANAELTTGRRFTSIVPQQALFRMNSLLVIEQARNIMEREDMKACTTDDERLKKLYEIIYQRWPKEREIQLAKAYIQSMSLESPESVSTVTQAGESRPPDLRGMTKKERQQYLVREKRKKRLEELAMVNKKRDSSMVKEAVRDPSAEKVDRSPLSPWEKYAHALLMTNEMAYVN